MSVITKDNVGSVVKDGIVILLLLVIMIILGVNRFFPKDSVDQETVGQMAKITDQMKSLREAIEISTASQTKLNAQLALMLDRRGQDREKTYNEMLSRYGADDLSDGVQSQDHSQRSQHQTSGGGSSRSSQ
ncbi:hypothetical protein [Stenotrophomonas phage BUCTxx100]|nr:hypothetical protein [Stenotrophomonas phage BUCTxx100]